MWFADLIARLTGAASVPAITHERLQEACSAGACHVVDVREPQEFRAGHLPAAINRPLSSFDPADLPTDKPVVLVCLSGARSGRAVRAAHAHGRTDVVHYAGGTSAWRARGGRLAS